MKKLYNIGLIGLAMRLGGFILCGALLEKTAVGNFSHGCGCFFITLLYFFISLGSFIISLYTPLCVILDIMSILIGLGLAYVAADTGHLFSSGAIFIITLFFIIANMLIQKNAEPQ